MKSMKKSLLGAAVCAALGFSATAQAGVVIDLFQDPIAGFQQVTTNVTGNTDFNQTGPFPTATVIGGYRDLSITKTAGALGEAATMTVSEGSLRYSNNNSVTSTGVVTWDGSNNAGAGGVNVLPTGFGGTGIDLTAAGTADSLFADVLSADLGFNYKITVWDMDGDMSELSAGVQFQVNSTISAHYLFDWFNLASGQYCDGVAAPPLCADPTTQLDFSILRVGGPIDFTRIGALQLTLTGARADVDLSIGSIETGIPEPGALALVGIALLGAGAASRRGRVAKS